MKYVVIVIFIFSSIVYLGCGSGEKDAVPAHILPKEKMVEIMVEVNITEAALNLNYLNEGKIKDTKEYSDVFKRKKVSKEQYDESLKYYTEHPEEMVKMYDEVLNELSKMQAKASAPPQEDTLVMPQSSPDMPPQSLSSPEQKKN